MRQALAPLPGDRLETIDAFRAAAHDAMAQLAAARPTEVLTATQIRAGTPDAACPYLGLGAFQPEDSDKFFGRETMVETLVQRMRAQRVLVVGGPSGSGKSSLIRAGLVAALRDGAIPGSENWQIDVFTPGRDALAELFFRLRGRGAADAASAGIGLDDFLARPTLARQVAAGSGPGAERVLVVDQFEELFTLNTPAQRQKFIDALAAITDPADSVFRIVLAIRADFYAACAALPWLAEVITHNQVLVGPMTAAELRRAIVEPARVAGYYLERNLIDAIVDEAGGEAGSLPLISHALVETWARRKGSTLTLEGYRATGGVAGAIRQTADAVFDERFDDAERATARRLLLNLVTPGEGTSDSRRILDRAELDRARDADTLRRVVERLTEARLLTVDDHNVQIAHEALLRSWPRLRDWIDESRGDLRVRVRLVQLAQDWLAGDRDPDLLLRGGRLVFALEWLEKNAETAGALERDFLDASVEARDRAEAAEAAREARARRRRAVAIGALSLLAAGATAASIVAITESRRARDNEGIARTATAVANERFSSALGAVSLGLVSEDPLLALELAAQSMGQVASPAATFDARAALVAARRVLADGMPVPVGSPVAAGDAHSLALSPDGAFAALGRRDGSVALFDARSRLPVGSDVEGGIGGIEDLGVRPGWPVAGCRRQFRQAGPLAGHGRGSGSARPDRHGGGRDLGRSPPSRWRGARLGRGRRCGPALESRGRRDAPEPARTARRRFHQRRLQPRWRRGSRRRRIGQGLRLALSVGPPGLRAHFRGAFKRRLAGRLRSGRRSLRNRQQRRNLDAGEFSSGRTSRNGLCARRPRRRPRLLPRREIRSTAAPPTAASPSGTSQEASTPAPRLPAIRAPSSILPSPATAGARRA